MTCIHRGPRPGNAVEAITSGGLDCEGDITMWIRRVLRTSLVIVAVGAAGVAFSGPAAAAPALTTHTEHHPSSTTLDISQGRTVLTLDKGTAGVLAENSVAVAPIAGATAHGRRLAFPIVGGSADRTTAAGTIEHSGGLTFSAGAKSLGVEDFVIDTTKGVLTARVSGTHTRVPLLQLDTSTASIHSGRTSLTVRNVRATLTREAAAALNSTFGVTLFSAGLPIGTATVRARA